MKKAVLLLLTAALCLGALGCGGKQKAEAVWVTNPEGGTSVPAEARDAFTRAMADFSGTGYVVMSYLGSQVSAGKNYAFLCRNTTLSVEPVTTLTVVTVCETLSGKAAILETRDVEPGAFSGETELSSLEPKGWSLNTSLRGVLPEDAEQAFEAAADSGLYMPLALLGSLRDGGCDYAVLCTAHAGERSALCVLELYTAPDGGAVVRSVTPFDIP